MTTVSVAALLASYAAWYAALRRRHWRAVNVAIGAVFLSTVVLLVSLH